MNPSYSLQKKMFEDLIEWSKNSFSQLPWRKQRTLYKTLVSEIMLQQTTVQTVQNHFPSFIRKYPNIHSVAELSEEEICIAWKGLGYYRRARNLRKACIGIQQNFNNKIPLDYEHLITIDGIGPYTANSLLAIGDNQETLALDANLERVLSRLYGFKAEKGLKLQKEIMENLKSGKWFISKILKNFGGSSINEALMDLGRTICQANRAQCELCPLRKGCFAFNTNTVDKFPFYPKDKKKKSLEKFDLTLLRLVVKHNKGYYFVRRKKGQWLEGQHELPTFVLKTNDKKLEQYPNLIEGTELINNHQFVLKSSITKYKITNIVQVISPAVFRKLLKSQKEELVHKSLEFNREENFSSVTIKILNKLEE